MNIQNGIDSNQLINSTQIPNVEGNNGPLMTGLDYNIIFNNASGLGFMSWTAKKSDAGHQAQVVDEEGDNILIRDGSWKFQVNEGDQLPLYNLRNHSARNWKFWLNEGDQYNLRNHSAPNQSFLATSKTKGDAKTDSILIEVSPDETTNELAGNGSWKFAGSQNNQNLINKDFNSESNFLSQTKTTAVYKKSSQLQVVAGEDSRNKKEITGSIKFTGPQNQEIINVDNGSAFQVRDITTGKLFNTLAVKELLKIEGQGNIQGIDNQIEVGPATLVDHQLAKDQGQKRSENKVSFKEDYIQKQQQPNKIYQLIKKGYTNYNQIILCAEKHLNQCDDQIQNEYLKSFNKCKTSCNELSDRCQQKCNKIYDLQFAKRVQQCIDAKQGIETKLIKGYHQSKQTYDEVTTKVQNQLLAKRVQQCIDAKQGIETKLIKGYDQCYKIFDVNTNEDNQIKSNQIKYFKKGLKTD